MRLRWTVLLIVLSVSACARAQQSASYQQIVNPQSTSLTLATSPSVVTASSPLALTARVSGSKGGIALVPSGTVSFEITSNPQARAGQPSAAGAPNNTLIDTAQLINGEATTTVTLPVGSYSVVATYGGSTNFQPTSASTAVDVVGPDFTFTLSTPAATIAQGGSLTSIATLTGVNGFVGQVAIACSDLPQMIGCNFSPATVAVNANSVQSTLTVSTVATTVKTLSAAFVMFAGVCFAPGLPERRKAKLRSWLGLIGLLLLASALSACAGLRYTQSDGTPKGTYKILVTATSGAISHSNTVTITVR